MADRKQMIETITGLLSGTVNPRKILDENRSIWIQTTEGYRDINGITLSEEQFKKWQAGSPIEEVIIIPDNGRERMNTE